MVKMKIIYCIMFKNIKKLKILKYKIFSRKHLFFSIIRGKCGSKYRRILKEKELMEILKVFGLIKNI